MKDWNDMSLPEKIASLPDRHPYPVKAALYLAIFVTPVPWDAVHKVLVAMGYIAMEVAEDFELETPVGVIKGRRVIAGWVNEPLNTAEAME